MVAEVLLVLASRILIERGTCESPSLERPRSGSFGICQASFEMLKELRNV